MVWSIILLILVVLFLVIIFKRIRPWWKKFLGLIFVMAGILFTSFKILFPIHPPVATTGPNPVQTDIIYLSHETVFPNRVTQDKKREIPVSVWMPETLKEKGHPLVIFSHGSFGLPNSNESLFLELASYGYIVASLAHPYHSFTSTLSNGKSITIDFDFFQSVMTAQGAQDLQGTLNNFNDWLGIRIEDINYTLDSFIKGESAYSKYINFNQVFLSGHSLGATAVLDIGRQRSHELAGIIALEGPYVGDIIGIENNQYVFMEKEYPLPVLHIYSDTLYGRMGEITTYQRNQEYIDLNSVKFVNIHIKGSGHLGLTDLSLASPILTGFLDSMTGGTKNTKDRVEKLKEINEASLDFLSTLK